MSKGQMFIYFVLGVALLLAILAVSMPLQLMGGVILFTRFFEVMIPVLAVGALVKYLLGLSFCK